MDSELSAIAADVEDALAGRASALDKACRRGEKRLASLGGSASEAGALRLATAVRDGRLRLVGDARDASAARSAAKAAWAAQRLTLEPLLRAAKRPRPDPAARRAVAAAVDGAQRAFAPRLEWILRDGAGGPAAAAAHGVLMALGDLERYREAHAASAARGTAAALYRRALRLRGGSGRCAYMLATLCASEKRFGAAAHWASRAAAAPEPWPAARGGLETFARECRRRLEEGFERTARGALDECEHHVACGAAVAAGGASGAGGVAASVRRHGAAAAAAARRAAAGGADESYRSVAARCVLGAALAADAAAGGDAAAAAADAYEALVAAFLDGPPDERADSAALVGLRRLARTPTSGGDDVAALAAYATWAAPRAAGDGGAVADDFESAGAAALGPPAPDDDVAALRAAVLAGAAAHGERCRRIAERAAALSADGALARDGSGGFVAPAAAGGAAPLGDVLKLLDIGGDAEPPAPAPPPPPAPAAPVEAEAPPKKLYDADAPPKKKKPPRRDRSPRARPPPPPPASAQRRPAHAEPAAGVRLASMAPLPPASLAPAADRLLFVVDVANVAMRHGARGRFSCRGIALCLAYLETRFAGNCRFAAFLPEYMLDAEKVAAKRRAHELGIRTARAPELPDDVAYLAGLERDGVLFATPSQDYDDSYQIEYARRHRGVIVSNDMFRDAVDKLAPHLRGALREWLRTHLLSYAFAGDEFAPNPDFAYPVAVQIQRRAA